MWDPNDWITDFATAYRTIKVPETTDPVLGLDEPVGAILFSALPDYSGSQFANMANNSLYNELRFIDDNVTLTVGNETQLIAAKDWLSRRTVLIGGVGITVNITASFSSDEWPIVFSGIVGDGYIYINGNGYSLTNTDNTRFFYFDRCMVEAQVYDVDLTNTDALGATYIEAVDCFYVRFVAVTFKEPTAASYGIKLQNVFNSSISGCSFEDDFISFLEMINSFCSVNASSDFGSIPTTQPIKISYGSVLHFDKLDVSLTGQSLTSPVYVGVVRDDSSRVHCVAYGTSGVVTFTGSDPTAVSADIQRFLDFMPKELNTDVTLVLPAITINAYPLTVEGFYGTGTLKIKGATSYTSKNLSLTTIISTDDDDSAVEIKHCRCKVVLDNLKLNRSDSGATVGSLAYILDSRNVLCNVLYAVSANYNSNGWLAQESQFVMIHECYCGKTDNGIVATDASYVVALDNVEENSGSSLWPAQYGNYATNGSIIRMTTGASNQINGASGSATSDNGGDTHAS